MADLTSTLCYQELVARINQRAGNALPLLVAELEEPHKRAKLLVDGSGCSENISVRCGSDTLFTARDH